MNDELWQRFEAEYQGGDPAVVWGRSAAAHYASAQKALKAGNTAVARAEQRLGDSAYEAARRAREGR